jgi:hypothetical protein
MTPDSLAVYLQDHLAGATAAIDLLSALHDQHAGEDLGEFCGRLLQDIESDHGVLESCFGGPKRNRLFMAASQSLYAVYVATQGAAPA